MKKPFADCTGSTPKDQLPPEIKVIAGRMGEEGAKYSVPDMLPGQDLSAGKGAPAGNCKADPDAEEAVWRRLDTEEMNVEATEPGSPRHKPAPDLMGQGHAGKRHTGRPGVSVTHQLMVKQREMMTHELDQYFISKGLSVEVELGGPDTTFISLFSPLFCKASVDRITKRTNLLFYLKEAGFRRATFGDSNEEVWAYDLRAL